MVHGFANCEFTEAQLATESCERGSSEWLAWRSRGPEGGFHRRLGVKMAMQVPAEIGDSR